jgi:hypothetical protein
VPSSKVHWEDRKGVARNIPVSACVHKHAVAYTPQLPMTWFSLPTVEGMVQILSPASSLSEPALVNGVELHAMSNAIPTRALMAEQSKSDVPSVPLQGRIASPCRSARTRSREPRATGCAVAVRQPAVIYGRHWQ